MTQKRLKKLLRKAYIKGRKYGFDKGFTVAKMLYTDIAADLTRTIEQLNSEIILNDCEEEDEDA